MIECGTCGGRHPEQTPGELHPPITPCVDCGDDTCSLCSHVRFGRDEGAAAYEPDKWISPLCNKCYSARCAGGARGKTG